MTRKHHLASLDAFRGIAVAGMILVNNPGNWNSVFPLLMHADWNGCTLADVVFPFFIFILGAAMPFAFARRIGQGDERRALYARIVRRTAWLVALGVLLNAIAAFPVLAGLRLPGVLQRIGLVYLLAAPLVLHVTPAKRVAILAGLTLAHWIVLIMPFGSAAFGLAKSNNLAGAIDAAVFGRHLLSAGSDPEGLLGTVPAVGTALLGSIAGECLRPGGAASVHLRRLVTVGLASMAAGWLWAYKLPLNKSLWTGSFVLWTGGLAALTLAVCYLLLDVAGIRRWARPFVWLGFNPLAIYFLSEAVGHLFDKPWLGAGGQTATVRSWLFWNVLRPRTRGMPDEWLSFAIGLATVVVWIGVAGVLYRRHIRIQV